MCLYILYYTGVGSLPNVYIEWILLYHQGSQHCGKSKSYFDVPDEMNSHLINNVPLDMAYLYTTQIPFEWRFCSLCTAVERIFQL